MDGLQVELWPVGRWAASRGSASPRSAQLRCPVKSGRTR